MRLSKLAGVWANIWTPPLHGQCVGALSVLFLMCLIRADVGPHEPLSYAFVIFMLSALANETLTMWRDQDMSHVLAHGRLCAHHMTQDAKPMFNNDHGTRTLPPPPPPSLKIDLAFMQLLSFLSLGLLFTQLVTIGIVFDACRELSDATYWMCALRVIIAVGDFINEVGRAAVIKYSTEPAYLNAQLGSGAIGRFELAPNHPEWHPWRGYRYFVLTTTAAAASEYGLPVLDDDPNAQLF